jgi:hypothetical protein
MTWPTQLLNPCKQHSRREKAGVFGGITHGRSLKQFSAIAQSLERSLDLAAGRISGGGLPDGGRSAEFCRTRGDPCARLIHGMNFAPEPLGIGRYTAELAAYHVTQKKPSRLSQAFRITPVESRPNCVEWMTK